MSYELLLETSDPEFAQTGLKVTSKIRVTRIVTLGRRLLQRRLGQLSVRQINYLNQIFIQAFRLDL